MSELHAIEKENVLIQAGSCAVTVLPRLGAKIASIRLTGQKLGQQLGPDLGPELGPELGQDFGLELLQTPLRPCLPRTRSMTFDLSDASGWDECLPSVVACSLETPAGIASIPDHGDLWRVAWQEEDPGFAVAARLDSSPTHHAVHLAAQCFSLPLRLARSVILTERKGASKPAWLLRLDYTLTNTGNFAAPWSWAAHPLFAAEAGDRILLPSSVHSLRLEDSRGHRLGTRGDQVSWPLATLPNGTRADLSLVDGPESGIGDKLFAGPLGASENWCILERPRAGVRIKVQLDPLATPYFGLWLCYGGWPQLPGKKQMCVAIEPATAPVDSLAETGPWSRILAPGESSSWSMDVQIETI